VERLCDWAFSSEDEGTISIVTRKKPSDVSFLKLGWVGIPFDIRNGGEALSCFQDLCHPLIA